MCAAECVHIDDSTSLVLVVNWWCGVRRRVDEGGCWLVRVLEIVKTNIIHCGWLDGFGVIQIVVGSRNCRCLILNSNKFKHLEIAHCCSERPRYILLCPYTRSPRAGSVKIPHVLYWAGVHAIACTEYLLTVPHDEAKSTLVTFHEDIEALFALFRRGC